MACPESIVTVCSFEAKAAEATSPSLARDWHFVMNVGEESLRAMLEKHCPELKLA